MKFEAGVTDIQYPYGPRWTGEIIDVDSMNVALDVFEGRGYYRNLVVRHVDGHELFEPCCSREDRSLAGGCRTCGDPSL